MMWNKKRYNIRIRLEPKDIDAIWFGATALDNLGDGKPDELKRLLQLYWKIHNKCVEINRR